MQLTLPYGLGSLRVEFPESVRVLAGPRAPAISDPVRELKASLDAPIAAEPLDALARGRQSACVVVSDNTRPVPNRLLLPPILERLRASVRRTCVLVATGLHAPLGEPEWAELFEGCALEGCEVRCHDALDSSQLVSLGSTARGIPIELNRLYVDSELRVLTGLIEPHFMAGYSGGRKSICPGIAGAETIQWFHSPLLLESPHADSCRLEGNPVHEEATSVARRVGTDLIVNVAIDSERRVTNVVAGDLESAWHEGVRFVASQAEVPIEHEADIVITTNGGHPQDRNFYQAVKGLVAAARAVRKDGAILLLSECRDGIGSPSFRANLELLRRLGDPQAYIDHISQPEHFTRDQWEVEKLVHVLRRTKNLFLLSDGLDSSDCATCFVRPVESVAGGIAKARAVAGSDAEILVMPEGPYLIPTLPR